MSGIHALVCQVYQSSLRCRIVTLFLLVVAFSPLQVMAIHNIYDNTYNTSAPTADDVPNWTNGWGTNTGKAISFL